MTGQESSSAGVPPEPADTAIGARSEVQALLDRLARAVTTGDGKAAAALWAVPALILGETEARTIGTPAELETHFGGAKEQYNARGITDTRAEIVELKWLTPRIATVQVRWPYLDRQGQEVGEETSTYTLRRDEGGALKLQAAVMHGASTGADQAGRG